MLNETMLRVCKITSLFMLLVESKTYHYAIFLMLDASTFAK